MWGKNFAENCLGKTAVELLTQVLVALGTPVLVSLSHRPIARRRGDTEEAAQGLSPSGWRSSLL